MNVSRPGGEFDFESPAAVSDFSLEAVSAGSRMILNLRPPFSAQQKHLQIRSADRFVQNGIVFLVDCAEGLIEAANYLLQASRRHCFGNERFCRSFYRSSLKQLVRIELCHGNGDFTVGIFKNCQAVRSHLPDGEVARLKEDRLDFTFFIDTGFPELVCREHANRIEM